mmetsp:Transcript_91358/g.258006  ORF Transcript_91358/g.258006 Transcript_91358/m.258006 type:complete len:218 (+) Transcript_91358:325-978(+)
MAPRFFHLSTSVCLALASSSSLASFRSSSALFIDSFWSCHFESLVLMPIIRASCAAPCSIRCASLSYHASTSWRASRRSRSCVSRGRCSSLTSTSLFRCAFGHVPGTKFNVRATIRSYRSWAQISTPDQLSSSERMAGIAGPFHPGGGRGRRWKAEAGLPWGLVGTNGAAGSAGATAGACGCVWSNDSVCRSRWESGVATWDPCKMASPSSSEPLNG